MIRAACCQIRESLSKLLLEVVHKTCPKHDHAMSPKDV